LGLSIRNKTLNSRTTGGGSILIKDKQTVTATGIPDISDGDLLISLPSYYREYSTAANVVNVTLESYIIPYNDSILRLVLENNNGISGMSISIKSESTTKFIATIGAGSTTVINQCIADPCISMTRTSQASVAPFRSGTYTRAGAPTIVISVDPHTDETIFTSVLIGGGYQKFQKHIISNLKQECPGQWWTFDFEIAGPCLCRPTGSVAELGSCGTEGVGCHICPPNTKCKGHFYMDSGRQKIWLDNYNAGWDKTA
jgi:hypothetical protein